MSASRLHLEIEPSALQRLLENDVLRVSDFSCTDMETKRMVLAIYRQLAVSRMRGSGSER